MLAQRISSITRKKKVLIPVSLLFLSFYAISDDHVFAANSLNDQFILNVDDIDTNPQPTRKVEPTTIPKPLFTPAPTISEFTTGKNYTVQQNELPFSITISQDAIDFGVLSANNPVIRTSDILLTHPLFGAQVLAYEDQPVTNAEKIIIPDTTCDNGVCTEAIASEWSSEFTYGFGYRCESQQRDVCEEGFNTSEAFKQYPDSSRNETISQVLQSTQSTAETTGKMYYKLNTSTSQQPGTYQNIVTFLAIPNY